MNLGMLVRADRTGLGNQTYNYWKFLKPYKTVIVDIWNLNGNKSNWDLYPDAHISHGFPTNEFIDEFLKGLDIIFTVETPYNYYLFQRAKELGIKSIMQYNWEFLDYLNQPDLPRCDLLLAPSLWHLDDMDNLDLNFKHLPVPIDREKLPFKQRTKCKVFLHIAGKKTFMDRNGTDIFLAAIPYVKSDVKFVIRSQQELSGLVDNRLTMINTEVDNYWELYNGEDVLVMPRKYGGLCLPLSESLSMGMIPLMTDCEPQSLFLKEESLVSPFDVKKIMTRTEIDCFETSPIRLAEKIDALANLPEDKVKELSNHSDKIASLWSWETLLPKYEEICKIP